MYMNVDDPCLQLDCLTWRQMNLEALFYHSKPERLATGYIGKVNHDWPKLRRIKGFPNLSTEAPERVPLVFVSALLLLKWNLQISGPSLGTVWQACRHRVWNLVHHSHLYNWTGLPMCLWSRTYTSNLALTWDGECIVGPLPLSLATRPRANQAAISKLPSFQYQQHIVYINCIECQCCPILVLSRTGQCSKVGCGSTNESQLQVTLVLRK